MKKTVNQFTLILAVFLALQGCVSHPSLTVEQLKGSLVVVQGKKLAHTQPQACDKIKSFYVPADHYPQAAKASGMLADDLTSLRQTVAQLQIIITVRNSNKSCEPYLRAGYPSKGHDVLTKTFTAESLPPQYKYLAGTVSILEDKPTHGEMIKDPLSKRYLTKDGNPLTCDYDLMDVAEANGERITGESDEDLQVRKQLNQNLPWRGQPPEPVVRIMHGAQAEYSNYLRATLKPDEKPLLWINKPAAPLIAFTNNGDVYRLLTIEDAFNFYRCYEIDIPPEWNIQEEN